MTLDTMTVGDTLTIDGFLDDQVHLMAIRLGMAVGETVTLSSKIMGGPLVLQRGNTEIALGRQFCRQIHVSRISSLMVNRSEIQPMSSLPEAVSS